MKVIISFLALLALSLSFTFSWKSTTIMQKLQPVPWPFTQGDHDSRMKVNNLTLNFESEKELFFTSTVIY